MLNLNIFKISGIIGLILICIAVLVKKREHRDFLGFFGGIGLLIYSVYLKDLIFIILQSVYIFIIILDFIKQKLRHA